MAREVTPHQIMVNGNPDADWSKSVWELWFQNISPLFKNGDSCSTANYYTPRPYRNTYDRGSDKEGFTYVVNPGQRVCFWERTVK